MITSESSYNEFRRFFNSHSRELNQRLYGVLNKKHRRTLLQLLKNGSEIPPIFCSLKVDDMTLYSLACGITEKKSEILFSAMASFLIMKDLRKQTRIMVIDIPPDTPLGLIYETHAISRYKERLGLDAEMDFVDVCKHMCSVGLCCGPRIVDKYHLIHGSNTDNREAVIMCANGVFMGRYSMSKDMHYAETFLSPNELSENQSVFDPTQSESGQQWTEYMRKKYKGEIPPDEVDVSSMENYYYMEDGDIKQFQKSEKSEHFEKFETFQKENPEILQAQIEYNRSKRENRIKRKGFK